ncbi:P-II family nitrogen regulator [Adlercreutzia equolifaciens]|uniref:P-II family nitrogen regulator n=1 Tax=Adlercreutzia equolifaciens TaxID=446660 RepID=UPI0023AF2D9F|nr:P-II family nitrogen regulator [Adlercreutzia equolifaciens]MDE8702775.1 P-II family nitrogen regulator [Adlercreutzia equolifaciens]
MKRVTAIVRPERMEPLKDALFAANVSGMTISQVHGCGAQHGWTEYVRGTEVLLNMVPKVKFEIVVDDGDVDGLVDIIIGAARTGEVGDGKIFVAPVEEVIRIRTGERGEEAV